MANASVKLEKNKLVAEDFEIGLGSVTQTRQNQSIQLTQINATHLLGPLVVDSVAKLAELNPNLMTTQTVIVKENHSIYTWDSTEQAWLSSTKSVYVIDDADDLVNVPNGYNTVLCNGFVYNKINNVWTMASLSVVAVDNYSDINNLPTGVTSVIVKTTGTMYYKQGLNWVQVQFSEVGDNLKVVDNVVDLAAQDSTTFSLVFLRSGKRSGIFYYDEEQQGITDGGIVFNGWVRQYDGNPSLYWYGVKGDGTTDDTAAIGSYLLQHDVIDLSGGEYYISSPLTITKSVRIEGNNATLNLGENVSINFIGKAQNPLSSVADISLGQSTFETQGSNTFEVGDLLLIKGTNVATAYSTNKMTSFMSNIAVKNGTTITLTQAAKSSITGPTISKINNLIVEISNVTIKQESSADLDTCISFEYCKNVKIENVVLQTKNVKTALELKNCYNGQLSACDINAYGTNSCALKVIDSDNTIIKSSNIFGQQKALWVGNDIRQVNQIGVFECILSTANNAIEDYSVYCEDAVVGVSVTNSQLAGNIRLGGYTHRYSNCIISCYDKITPAQMNGGEISFINCTLIFLMSTQQNIAFGNGSSSNVIETDWFSVTSPMHFEFVDNTFILSSQYNQVLQLVAVPAGSKTALCQHSISYYGNTVSGGVQDIKEVVLYGPFNKVRIECKDKSVDLTSIYTASVTAITAAGITTPKSATMETFFTLGNYTSKQLCFSDATVDNNNIKEVTTSVTVTNNSVKHNTGTTYALANPIKLDLVNA